VFFGVLRLLAGALFCLSLSQEIARIGPLRAKVWAKVFWPGFRQTIGPRGGQGLEFFLGIGLERTKAGGGGSQVVHPRIGVTASQGIGGMTGQVLMLFR
jgi:hypothetical protein